MPSSLWKSSVLGKCSFFREFVPNPVFLHFVKEENKPFFDRFPGLKPPRPPAPSPPASKREQGIEPITVEEEAKPKAESDPLVDSGTGESDGSVTGSVAGFETGKSSAQESAAREEEALAKARAATSFVWPWQKPKPLENEVTEEAVPPVPETVTKIPPSSSRPLSPYAQYVTCLLKNSWFCLHLFVVILLFHCKTNQGIPNTVVEIDHFLRFPDLKPPSPPRASLILEAAPTSSSSSSSLSSSSTPLSPYTGYFNTQFFFFSGLVVIVVLTIEKAQKLRDFVSMPNLPKQISFR
jgi:hypothetical protein